MDGVRLRLALLLGVQVSLPVSVGEPDWLDVCDCDDVGRPLAVWLPLRDTDGVSVGDAELDWLEVVDCEGVCDLLCVGVTDWEGEGLPEDDSDTA